MAVFIEPNDHYRGENLTCKTHLEPPPFHWDVWSSSYTWTCIWSFMLLGTSLTQELAWPWDPHNPRILNVGFMNPQILCSWIGRKTFFGSNMAGGGQHGMGKAENYLPFSMTVSNLCRKSLVACNTIAELTTKKGPSSAISSFQGSLCECFFHFGVICTNHMTSQRLQSNQTSPMMQQEKEFACWTHKCISKWPSLLWLMRDSCLLGGRNSVLKFQGTIFLIQT